MDLQNTELELFLDNLETYKQKRNDDIIFMRNAGATFQVIADKYHITRQRVNQIYCAHSRAQLSSPPAAQD